MEPLFFKAENVRVPIQMTFSLTSFNGAAFFQSGKSAFSGILLDVSPTLQWSRFFSKRKMLIATDNGDRDFVASMEPLFFKAENKKLRSCFRSVGKLQWSRFFSKRKMATLVWLSMQVGLASMEPLFFKAENFYASHYVDSARL